MTEPIIGWRAWSLCRPVDRWDFAEVVAILESSASFAEVRERAARAMEFQVESWSGKLGRAWTPRMAKAAICDQPGTDHQAPHPKCMCGYWAFKTLEDLWVNVPGAPLYGEVALWGKVFEHQYGYRAEYAYPVSFHTSTEGPIGDVRKAAERFGVPAHCEDDSAEFENKLWERARETDQWKERFGSADLPLGAVFHIPMHQHRQATQQLSAQKFWGPFMGTSGTAQTKTRRRRKAWMWMPW